MKKEKATLAEIRLVGITARTRNANEADPSLAKIAPAVQRWFQENLSAKVPHRANPGRTFCAYTEYESDFRGEYTFFIGEEVRSFDGLPEGFRALAVEAQGYVKLTTQPGLAPDIVIEAWRKIWQMTPGDLGGQRRYSVDFEVYDDRTADPRNAVVDIYIGVK